MSTLTEYQRLRRKEAFWEVAICIGAIALLTIGMSFDHGPRERPAWFEGPVAGMCLIGALELMEKVSIGLFGKSFLGRRH
jgi:hypothetical protein